MSEVKTDKLSPRTASGTVTLGTSGDTFSIPSGATLDIASGATIANNGTASGFGKVLQVVQTIKTNTFSTTSNSFVEVTGSGVSITPSSTSNKVLYMLSFHYSANGEAAGEEFAIYKNGSLLSGYSDGTKTKGGVARSATGSANYIYLDSPSTTSEVTYALYIRETSTYTASINAVLTAVAMEIGA